MSTPKKPIEQAAEPAYTPAKGEEKYVHVRMEKPHFDSATGAKLSSPVVRKFSAPDWKTAEQGLKKQGYTYEILHKP